MQGSGYRIEESNMTKTILITLSTLAGWFIGKQLGLWVLAAYALTGGVITAADIVTLRHVFPVVVAILALVVSWDKLRR